MRQVETKNIHLHIHWNLMTCKFRGMSYRRSSWRVSKVFFFKNKTSRFVSLLRCLSSVRKNLFKILCPTEYESHRQPKRQKERAKETKKKILNNSETEKKTWLWISSSIHKRHANYQLADFHIAVVTSAFRLGTTGPSVTESHTLNSLASFLVRSRSFFVQSRAGFWMLRRELKASLNIKTMHGYVHFWIKWT